MRGVLERENINEREKIRVLVLEEREKAFGYEIDGGGGGEEEGPPYSSHPEERGVT